MKDAKHTESIQTPIDYAERGFCEGGRTMNETRYWRKIVDGRFVGKKTVEQRQQYLTEPFNSLFGSHFDVWVSYIIKGDRNDFEPEDEGWFFYFYNSERGFFGFKGPFMSPETAKEAGIREVVYEIQRIYDLVMSYRIAQNETTKKD